MIKICENKRKLNYFWEYLAYLFVFDSELTVLFGMGALNLSNAINASDITNNKLPMAQICGSRLADF